MSLIADLKRNQSSIRERVLARKRGLQSSFDTDGIDSKKPKQDSLLDSSSTSLPPLSNSTSTPPTTPTIAPLSYTPTLSPPPISTPLPSSTPLATAVPLIPLGTHHLLPMSPLVPNLSPRSLTSTLLASSISTPVSTLSSLVTASPSFPTGLLSTSTPSIEETSHPALLEGDLDKLLNQPSIKERERNQVGKELVELLERQSVKEKSLVEKFKTKGGPKVTVFCPNGTTEDCKRERQKTGALACDKIHFRRIIKAHTDTALGDCSYLDTCRHMKTCKFVHYEMDDSPDTSSQTLSQLSQSSANNTNVVC